MNASMFVAIIGFIMVLYFGLRPKRRTAQSSQARLKRVRIASLIFSALLWVSFPLSAYWFFGFLFGWPGPSHDGLRILVGHHVYSAPSEVPPAVFWLFVVKQGLAFFAGFVLLRLFWLYGRGIIFSVKNVNCLRFLGYYLIIDWFVNYEMQGLQHEMSLSTNAIFYGLFIIFFAWIMDEGRKIQEEQELTV